MEGGEDRARRALDDRPERSGGRRAALHPEQDDVLARLGLLSDDGAPLPAGGRAARRRAAEARETAEAPPPGGRRRRRDDEPPAQPRSDDPRRPGGTDAPSRSSGDDGPPRPLTTSSAGRRRAGDGPGRDRPDEPPRGGRHGYHPEPRGDDHSGALERTQALRPGWVSARDGGRPSTAALFGSNAETVRLPARRTPSGPRRRAAEVDPPTVKDARPVDAPGTNGRPADGRRLRAVPDEDGAEDTRALRRRRAASEPPATEAGHPADAEQADGAEATGADATRALRGVRRRSDQPDADAQAEATRALRSPRRRAEPEPADAEPADATRALRRGARTPEPAGADADSRRLRSVAPDEPQPGRRLTAVADPADVTTAVPMKAGERADPATHKVRRAQRIDETLTRLTAAHAGLELASDQQEPEPEPRSSLTPLKLLCLLLAVVVLGATAFGWFVRGWLERGIPTVSALDPGSSSVLDAAAQKGATNVLVVAGEHEQVPGTALAGSTPETVTLAHVPAGGGPLTVVTFPPNLEINRPPCEQYDPISRGYTATVPAEARTQLASALAVGGPRCVTRVVQQLTGVAVTGYLGVDLDKLATLVGTAGGVQVCVPRPVVDGALGPIMPQAGQQTLDGTRAGDFLRASAVPGDSPAGRVERQQGVLAGVIGPLASTTGLLNVSHVAATRPALGNAVVTDGLDLNRILATATSLRSDGAPADVVHAATPTAPTANARGNLELRDTDAAALFAALRTGKPLPEAATRSDTAAGPKPADVTVRILNASDREGLAGTVSTTLGQLGFGIGQVANAPQRTPQTLIRFSPDQQAAADLLATTVPSATLVPDPGRSGVLELVIGRSFDDELRPPVVAAAAAADQKTGPPAQCP